MVSARSSILTIRDLPARRSRQRDVVAGIAATQDFQIEEAKRRHLHHDRLRFELALFDEVQLVLADVLPAELLGRAMEVFGEPPDTRDIGVCGSLRVITELEFLKHLCT